MSALSQFIKSWPLPLAIFQQVVSIPTHINQERGFFDPVVTIDSPPATITGNPVPIIGYKAEEFLGIPFAHPPVGDRRLKPPLPITESLGSIHAQANKYICPQLVFTTDPTAVLPVVALAKVAELPIVQQVSTQSEDCLTLNVYRPGGTKAGDDLPVLFWIFGGGFELGWNSMYQGGVWVENSVEQKQPMVVVTVSYRVGGHGFLGGKELADEGSTNLGLLDQRLGLQWVADNIEAFGGDPSKVTIWGESAGSISVFNHMAAYDGNITYKGKPLFRGAIMNSGSVVPADPVDSVKPQLIFDTVVKTGGCTGAKDKLACLRKLSYSDFNSAVNSVPGLLGYDSVALSYVPRPDGDFLTASPDVLGMEQKIAKVPFIVGDMEDEGTLFALFQANLTTKEEVVDYLDQRYFLHAGKAEIGRLVDLYDDIDENGSPFRTGDETNWYPQFKRLAAILGDLVFTITRRGTLHVAVEYGWGDVPFWSYINSYYYGTPILGSGHGLDILSVFYGWAPGYATKAWRQYYVNFVNNLDPNVGGVYDDVSEWPQWVDSNRTIIQMFPDRSEYIKDDFRQPVFEYLLENISKFYF